MEKVNSFEPQECVGSLQRERGWHGSRGWGQHPLRVPPGSAGGMRALVGGCNGNGVAGPGGTWEGTSMPGKGSRRGLGGGCSPRQPDFSSSITKSLCPTLPSIPAAMAPAAALS